MQDFFNSARGRINLKDVCKDIVFYMNEVPEEQYNITLGTDSEKNADGIADFVTAIVIHRVGKGGKYYWKSFRCPSKFHTLGDRMFKEAELSVEFANKFIAEMKSCSSPKFHFEIHVDVGSVGETKNLIQSLVGMIRAYNFEVKTKPDSYAASKVADRHT